MLDAVGKRMSETVDAGEWSVMADHTLCHAC